MDLVGSGSALDRGRRLFVISGFLTTAHVLREVESTGRSGLPGSGRGGPEGCCRRATSCSAPPPSRRTSGCPRSTGSKTSARSSVRAFTSRTGCWLPTLSTNLASGYDPSVLQHYWTLSVEERFLPRLAAVDPAPGRPRGAYPHRSRTAVPVVMVYFVTPTRAWQFGVGAVLAVGGLRWRTGHRRLFRDDVRSAISWAGVAGLIWCGLEFSASIACPAVAGGVNLDRDDGHISTTYARPLAPYIYRDVLRFKVLKPRPH